MSAVKNEKDQILVLLQELGNESLIRSHNSVSISFEQMLAYIKKVRLAGLSKEIKKLLETYQEMAKKYYFQFELSLLTEIKRQRDIRDHSEQIINKIKDVKIKDIPDLGTDEWETATHLLNEANINAGSSFDDLVMKFPTLMQSALDKLRAEWVRLNTIANSKQTIKNDQPLLKALEAVVKAAAYSVGIETDRIVVVPGDAFALYFFSYMDNFAILTVPISSVRAPWEWSIFWHELAGYRVRQLKTSSTLDDIKTRLKRFHKRYRNDANKGNLIKGITGNNGFCLMYLNKLLSGNLILRDLGNFDHQFERVLENLDVQDKFQAYEVLKSEGWCVDWFEELFEDAFSIIAVGKPFLPFFEDILSRHQGSDGRHPPLSVRLAVAEELLRLMDPNEEAKRPTTIEESAAQQILRFISLLLAASFHFEEQDDNPDQLFRNLVRYDFPDYVGRKIGTYIETWSNDFLNAENRAIEAAKGAEDFINSLNFSELEREFIESFAYNENKEITPSFEALLEGKDYRQLLELSFYDQDFGTTITYEFLFKESNKVVNYKITPNNLNAALNNKFIFVSDKNNSNLTINGKYYWTSQLNFNNMKAPPRMWISKV